MDIDPIELDPLSRSGITKTCRQIINKIIPKENRVGSSWKTIPVVKQNAVLGKRNKYYDIFSVVLLLDLARLLNPAEQKKSDPELIKACRNVFEVANSFNRKQIQAENQNEEYEMIDDQD